MQKAIKAVYENGVFKPLREIDIEEHQNVDLYVLPEKVPTSLSVQRIINHLKEGHFPKRSIEEMASDTEIDIDWLYGTIA